MIKGKKYKTGFAFFILLGSVLFFSCRQEIARTTSVVTRPDNHIRLSEAQIQIANIKVTEATERVLYQQLSLSGVIKVNELGSVTISSRAKGRIQKLFFKNTGEFVNKGDALYELYSDNLVAAEKEYYTLQSNNWNFSKKYEPSLALESKLLLMGMLPSQITELGKTGKILFVVTIYSQAGGTIRSINVSDGQYVDVGTRVLELADADKLWVEALAYPDELQFLKVGLPADIIFHFGSNMHIKSSVSFINPAFEPGKNVTIIRAIINNPDKKVHPGMFVRLSVQTQMSQGIVIPLSSVIIDKSGSQVWIQDEDGSFASRIVRTGVQSNDSIIILSGINKSQKIVFSGAYLLHSEMILNNSSVTME